jgi:long-chain acyl-CoA synthetase
MQIMMKPVWQRWFIHIALNAGDKYARSKRSKTKLSLFNLMLYLAMDRFVLNKIRSVLGTHIKYLISGSAPMPKWLLERYHALGLLVLEAYGISENIIPNAMNIPEDFKFGTVGKPISENMIALLEDDELLVKGPGVFSGYYNDNNQKELFTSDGYFPTGDYASFDKDGYLSITGRKSEVFKTSTGRKISPVSIESRLQQIFYVEHAVLFGQGKKFLTALVTISPSILAKQLGTKEDSDLDYKNLLSKEALGIIAYDLFFQIEPFPNFKRPAGIYITDHQLSVEMKELTSNLKLKRKNIEENFKYHLAQMNNYIEKGDVPDTLSTFKKVDGMVLFF